MTSDLRKIIAGLRRQHWQLAKTAEGHFRAVPPNPDSVIVIFSDSADPHAQLNIVRDLKESGFIWPEPSKKDQKKEKTMTKPLTQPLLTNERLNTAFRQPPPAQPTPASPPPFTELKPVELPSSSRTAEQLFQELQEAALLLATTEKAVIQHQVAIEMAAKALAAAKEEYQKAAYDMVSKRAALFDCYPPPRPAPSTRLPAEDTSQLFSAPDGEKR